MIIGVGQNEMVKFFYALLIARSRPFAEVPGLTTTQPQVPGDSSYFIAWGWGICMFETWTRVTVLRWNVGQINRALANQIY